MDVEIPNVERQKKNKIKEKTAEITKKNVIIVTITTTALKIGELTL